MVVANLIGFVRKSKNGNALKINISTAAFKNAITYTGLDGREYVQLIVPLNGLKKVITGDREYTTIGQIVG